MVRRPMRIPYSSWSVSSVENDRSFTKPSKLKHVFQMLQWFESTVAQKLFQIKKKMKFENSNRPKTKNKENFKPFDALDRTQLNVGTYQNHVLSSVARQ